MEEETGSKRRTELNEPLIPVFSRRHVFDLLQVRGSSRTRASHNTRSTGRRRPCPHSTRSVSHSRSCPSGSSTIRPRRHGRRHAPHRPRRRRRAERAKAQESLRRAAARQVDPRPLRRQIDPPKRTHRRAGRGIRRHPPRRRRRPVGQRHRRRRRRRVLRHAWETAGVAGRPPAVGQDAGRVQQRGGAEAAPRVLLGPGPAAAAGGAGLRGERRAGIAAGLGRRGEGVRRRRRAAVWRVCPRRADAWWCGWWPGWCARPARGAD